MKKALFGVIALVSCFILTGCFEKVEINPKENTSVEDIDVQENTSAATTNISKTEDETETTNTEVSNHSVNEVALAAIREALKDENWVKENLMMKNTCFGDEISENQELTFKKVGKDKVVVEAFAYDSNDFGVACTIVSYQDGKVVTHSEPSLEAPAHPGHTGYGVNSENEMLASYYMHMGYYMDSYFQINSNNLTILAAFEASEFGENGILLENESGDLLVDYTSDIEGVVTKGRTTFDNYEELIVQYLDGKVFEAIDTPLTDENVDLYLK